MSVFAPPDVTVLPVSLPKKLLKLFDVRDVPDVDPTIVQSPRPDVEAPRELIPTIVFPS